MEQTKKKANNGITLVALVATTIILLILVGVTIGALGGENGLIAKAKKAKQKQMAAEMKEDLILAISELQLEKEGKATLDDITQEWANSTLEKYNPQIISDEPVDNKKITMEKNDVISKYIIDKNLNIVEVKNVSLEFSYDVISKDLTKAQILIHIQDKENGISTIELPDGDIIKVVDNRNKEIGIDYEVELEKEYMIKITLATGEVVEEKIKVPGLTEDEIDVINGWILIHNEEELIAVSKDLTKKYKIVEDIVLTKTWIPLGNSSNQFVGEINGAGHKITGLENGTSTVDYQGLIGYIGTTGKVSNLSIEGNISGSSNVGILAGYNQGTITNVNVSGTVTGSGDNIGGLVGYNYSGTITNAKASGTVAGSSKVGGLAGFNYYGTIENAYSTGEVTGGNNVGGLVGDNNNGAIRKSASSAKTTGSRNVGGLAGDNWSGTIENAYSTGEVTGNQSVGGLVGYNDSRTTITNTYTISKVNGTGSYIGGLVGYNQGVITNSYWTPEKAGVVSSQGGIKIELTTDMQKQSTYEGFDFTQEGKIWVMKEYPELEWMQ